MISNPPFMGGRRISSNYGEAYEKYLKRVVLAGEKGSINLVLYFLLRGAELLRVYGAAGFIATDAIRESDTREVGVSRLFKIVSPIRAISSIPWSGSASVSVSILGLWKGEWRGKIILDSREVGAITTQLEAGVELATPHRLLQNAGICSDGVKVQGIGFVLSAEEAGSIIKSHPESTQVITRYIVGDDINTDVQQLGDRWVINFWNMSESDAMRFVAAWDIVVERVRPYREGLTRQVHEECFWKFWDRREAFFNRVRKKGKVLVGSKLSKHFALVFGDPHFIYSEKAKVFDFASYSAFAVLQSTFHTIWALQWGSSTGETPAYVGGACFDTFPFPECLLKRGSVASDIEWDSLCAAGDRYYEHRGSIGRNREEGLTKLYNRFHDRAEKAADVMAFRECSIELDATVAQSYGWQDLKMDHGFYETRTGIRFTISGNCRAEILARTMELNTRRYILEQEGDSSQRRPARVQKIKLRKRN